MKHIVLFWSHSKTFDVVSSCNFGEIPIFIFLDRGVVGEINTIHILGDFSNYLQIL